MFRWFVEKSLQTRYLVIFLAAGIMLFGIMQLGTMPVAVFPEVAPVTVQVQTEALGLSAEEVESLITVPMEADLLNGVAWLETIHSESVAGLSSVEMIFEPGTDPIKARQMVQERLTQAFALPNVSSAPMMLQPLSSSNRVMTIGLSSEEVSLIDMSVLAHWVVQPRLLGVPGVANVAIWGQRDWQIQVQVDPARLHENGVTLRQIIETTGEALWVSPLSFLESSSPGTAGWLDTPNQRLNLQHVMPISSPADLAEVPISDNEAGLLLGDVANVVEDHQPLIGDALVNNGEGLLLVVEVFPETNLLRVTRDVEAALDAMRPGLAGIEIDTTIFRPANYIEYAIDNLANAVTLGAVLMAAVIALLFFNWRAALITIIVIPVSLIATSIVLYFSGVTMNAMVLSGLVVALGIIIDDAVVGVENAARRFRQRQLTGERSFISAVVNITMEMRNPLIFATLIILLSVTPVFVLSGMSGAFFQPLASAYLTAVVVSLIVAMTITPVLTMILMARAPSAQSEPPLIRQLQRGYSTLLTASTRVPIAAPFIGAVVFVGSLIAIPSLSQSLQPSFNQTDLRIQWDGAPSTSRAEMLRMMSQAVDELRAVPGVRNVAAQVGRAITGDQIVTIDSGELWVSIDPNANYAETHAAINSVVGGYPGLLRKVETFEPERLEEAVNPQSRDTVVRIYGSDFDQLHELAAAVSGVVSEVDGVEATHVDFPSERPQLEIMVDLEAARENRVLPGDVRRTATTLLSGLRVGNLYEQQKVFDVMVWSTAENRESVSDIENLLIDTPTGELVRLGDIADIHISPSPVVVRRDAVSRYIDVIVDVNGRDRSAVIADIHARLNEVSYPAEYRAEILGNTDDNSASLRMIALIVTIVLGSLLLLQACFGSWRLAFISILTFPIAALGGGVLTTYLLNGAVLSIGTLFGLMAVLGVAVRNNILLINHYQYLMLTENEVFGFPLILRASRERLAPTLMTLLITIAGLVPIIISGRAAGTEIIHPMALILVGGLVVSTFFTLFVVPSLYLRFGPHTVSEDLRVSMPTQLASTSN